MSVAQLLADPTLRIPEYQRPYKWTVSHVERLFADIARYKNKSAYRLGTIVFHREDGQRNIVDGQQRTISLLLAAHALIETRLKGPQETRIQNPRLLGSLHELATGLLDPEFSSTVSQANVHANYLAISRIVSRPDFSEDVIDFLLNKCELVWFELSDISAAFQFFDSQNARGRDLEPHDLLKAFHLREFTSEDAHLKVEVVSQWENSDSSELAQVFSEYLYRIRNWSRGAPARYFGKEDVHLFKGVNLERSQRYPYLEQMAIAHRHIDGHNRQAQAAAGGRRMGFPFQLDQIIINGRRFFEMISHYQGRIGHLRQAQWPSLDGFAPRILQTIDNYPGCRRVGDRSVRILFDCLLIHYIDRFGMVEISRAVEKAFVWAYSLRLCKGSLQLAGLDNYVLDNNMFLKVRQATEPAEVLNVELPVLSEHDVLATRAGPIVSLFKDMRYHD